MIADSIYVNTNADGPGNLLSIRIITSLDVATISIPQLLGVLLKSSNDEPKVDGCLSLRQMRPGRYVGVPFYYVGSMKLLDRKHKP